jgi:hypothetical protein
VLTGTPSSAASAPSPAHSAASGVGVVAVGDSPYDGMDATDLRVAVVQKLALPYAGSRVKAEAAQLLDSGTPEEMRDWLESGYRLAQAQDDRVAIVQMLATPGISAAMRQAVYDQLDENSPEAMRYFLAVGQYEIDG